MPNKFTTIRVYEKDKDALIERYGGHAHIAFRKVIQDNCIHPENARTYVVAELPAMNEEAITEHGERRNVGGFYCEECGMYVFRKTNTLPVAE